MLHDLQVAGLVVGVNARVVFQLSGIGGGLERWQLRTTRGVAKLSAAGFYQSGKAVVSVTMGRFDSLIAMVMNRIGAVGQACDIACRVIVVNQVLQCWLPR
ncbi:hypothetical protein D9M70_619580 [compost metagenome]